MMAEVVSRRCARMRSVSADDYDESFAAVPNLVIIDGGKGQLSAALAAMQAYDLPRVAVIALAKRAEEVFVPGRPDPIVLDPGSAGLQLLQRIRDEAHRFALGFHRQRRDAQARESILDALPASVRAQARAHPALRLAGALAGGVLGGARGRARRSREDGAGDLRRAAQSRRSVRSTPPRRSSSSTTTRGGRSSSNRRVVASRTLSATRWSSWSTSAARRCRDSPPSRSSTSWRGCGRRAAGGRRRSHGGARLRVPGRVRDSRASLLPQGRPRSHHVHAVLIGSDLWERHLAFRDYLRANSAEAEAYAEFKVEARPGRRRRPGRLRRREGGVRGCARRAGAFVERRRVA